MTKLKIKVTKKIIKESMLCGTIGYGKPTAVNCAVALAVRDIFPDARVSQEHIYPFHKLIDTRILLPEEASRFIWRFDFLKHSPHLRLLMKELEFEIEIPDDLIECINIDELKPLLVNHPTLELVEA